MDEPAANAPCMERLARSGVRFTVAVLPPPPPLCRIDSPVRLEAVGTVSLPDRPVLACAFAERFASFVADLVAPAGRGLLEAEVTALGTGPGFDCRPRNRAAGAKMSAHGQGLAVDIAVIRLGNGTTVSVERPAGEAQRRFVDTVRRAACGWFSTVLGPGSDSAHADHIHLDAERRGRTGESKLCQ